VSLTRLDRTAVGALRLLLDAQPTTGAKVTFAWTIAAGPGLARAADVSWSETGTLRVRPRTDAWRQEIVRARPVIANRLASLLGPGVVGRISVDLAPDAAPPGAERRRPLT
jgi:hypothetical protein